MVVVGVGTTNTHSLGGFFDVVLQSQGRQGGRAGKLARPKKWGLDLTQLGPGHCCSGAGMDAARLPWAVGGFPLAGALRLASPARPPGSAKTLPLPAGRACFITALSNRKWIVKGNIPPGMRGKTAICRATVSFFYTSDHCCLL